MTQLLVSLGKFLPRQMPPGHLPPGQLPSKTIAPLDNYPLDHYPLDNCPPDNYPLDNYPLDDCPPDNYPPGNCPPRTIAPPGQLPPRQLPPPPQTITPLKTPGCSYRHMHIRKFHSETRQICEHFSEGLQFFSQTVLPTDFHIFLCMLGVTRGKFLQKMAVLRFTIGPTEPPF